MTFENKALLVLLLASVVIVAIWAIAELIGSFRSERRFVALIPGENPPRDVPTISAQIRAVAAEGGTVVDKLPFLGEFKEVGIPLVRWTEDIDVSHLQAGTFAVACPPREHVAPCACMKGATLAFYAIVPSSVFSERRLVAIHFGLSCSSCKWFFLIHPLPLELQKTPERDPIAAFRGCTLLHEALTHLREINASVVT